VTPALISTAVTASPNGSGCRAPSNSTTPATKLTVGSVIVIAVSAVGSEPLEKASWASSPPVSVETRMHGSGQVRCGRSSVVRTMRTALAQKQIPAATATTAARS